MERRESEARLKEKYDGNKRKWGVKLDEQYAAHGVHIDSCRRLDNIYPSIIPSQFGLFNPTNNGVGLDMNFRPLSPPPTAEHILLSPFYDASKQGLPLPSPPSVAHYGSSDKAHLTKVGAEAAQPFGTPSFLTKVMNYLDTFNTSFVHADLWCFDDTVQRLVFTGCATSPGVSREKKRKFELWGDYSKHFSFAIGAGLPGRVFKQSTCYWEQQVDKAPKHCFERAGGASAFGIKTVAGLSIDCFNAKSLVLCLYSMSDVPPDNNLASAMKVECLRLSPKIRTKITVEIHGTAKDSTETTKPDNSSASAAAITGTKYDEDLHVKRNPFLERVTSITTTSSVKERLECNPTDYDQDNFASINYIPPPLNFESGEF